MSGHREATQDAPPPCQECGNERGWYGFCPTCGADPPRHRLATKAEQNVLVELPSEVERAEARRVRGQA